MGDENTEKKDTETKTDAASKSQETEKQDFRSDFFRVKSEKENLHKQFIELEAKHTELAKQVDSGRSSQVELLRLKKAYEAGVPSHLLKLVTETTEEKIDDQIKAIIGELVATKSADNGTKKSDDNSSKSTDAGNAKDKRPDPADENKSDWVARYSNATPAERVAMMKNRPGDLFANVGK